MNANSVFARFRIVRVIIAMILSTVIAIALLTSAIDLFLRDGAVLEQVVAAENACAGAEFVSERQACVRSYLSESPRPRVATRSPHRDL